MRVFFDTNIIVDILTQRQPHFADSEKVLRRCTQMQDEIFVAWHGVATAFYLQSIQIGAAKSQQSVADFLQTAVVATVGNPEAQRAFTLGFKDLEDAMQAVAAEACGADFIVTRNTTDFAASPVPVLAPADFLAQFPVV